MPINCPQCSASIEDDSIFCDMCGANVAEIMEAATAPHALLDPATSDCPVCGHPNPPRMKFCDNCGAQLVAPAASPPPPAEPVPPPSAPASPPQTPTPPQPEPAAPSPPAQYEAPAPPPGPVAPITPPAPESPQLEPATTAPPPAPAEPPPSPTSTPPQPEPAAAVPHPTPSQPEPAVPVPAPSAPAAPAPQAPTPPAPSGPGRFVVHPAGASLPIPPGLTEAFVGREDVVSSVFPEIDLQEYDALSQGVGRRHARLTFRSGQVFIEDLTSVNGTHINGQRLQPKQPVALNDGDELLLGKLKLTYHAV